MSDVRAERDAASKDAAGAEGAGVAGAEDDSATGPKGAAATGPEDPAPASRAVGDAARVAVSVVGILVAAFAVQLATTLSGSVLVIVLIVLALAAIVVGVRLVLDPHLVRTRGGLALVRNVAAPDGSRVRVLAQGGVYQSATYLDGRRFEPVFAYQRAFETMFEAEDALRASQDHGIRRVLAIGGGGYAWPKYALMHHAKLSLDVVELDPAVTAAARRWFFVDELEQRVGERLRLIEGDGRAYLDETAARIARGEGEPYDAIVNDTFAGREPVRALVTVEAARAAKACLAPGGLYLTNVVSAGDGTDLSFLRDEVATLSQVFAHVSVVPATDETWSGEDNYLVIASDAAYTFTDAIPYDPDFLGTPLRD